MVVCAADVASFAGVFRFFFFRRVVVAVGRWVQRDAEWGYAERGCCRCRWSSIGLGSCALIVFRTSYLYGYVSICAVEEFRR